MNLNFLNFLKFANMQFLPKPQQVCYVIKKPVTQTIYSIDVASKKTLVAFKSKSHAQSFKRLMFEMDIKDERKKKTIEVERVVLDKLIEKCNVSSLNLLVYSTDVNYIMYAAQDYANDDIIFKLENTFRYG